MIVKARSPSGDSGGYHIGICPDVLITSLNIYSEVYIYTPWSIYLRFKKKEKKEEKKREEKSKEKERKKRNVCTHVVL